MKIITICMLIVFCFGCEKSEPNEPAVMEWDDPNATIDSMLVVGIDPTIVIAHGQWTIELEIAENGLILTGDLDRLDEGAAMFFNEYLKSICDEYIENNLKEGNEE